MTKKPAPAELACESCAYVTEAPIDPQNIGAPRALQCRRFPPTSHPVNVGGQIAMAVAHPQVPPGGYCGEYEPNN